MTEKLRRGFKTEAESIALEMRRELRLSAFDPLDCFALADHLDIPVYALRDTQRLGMSFVGIDVLSDRDEGFSAVTVCAGTRCAIVYNCAHSPARRASDVTHELSHLVHDHPAAPIFAVGGLRHWDERCEAEAEWQTGALLVPRDGALAVMRQRDTIDEGIALGMEHFGVSRELFVWRINTTGIIRQLSYRPLRRVS